MTKAKQEPIATKKQPSAAMKTMKKSAVAKTAQGESVAGIMKELETLGAESIRHVLRKHGAQDPFYGVRIGDMKPIVKRIKVNYQLALDLYDTGNYDAMYFAGLIANDARMTRKDLNKWAKNAQIAHCGSTVPWVAAGSLIGLEMAREWIEAKDDKIAAIGWSTWCSLLALIPNEKLDLDELKKLLDRVQKTLQQSPDKVRYSMNMFVISLAIYVGELRSAAIAAAKKIGTVEVDMGDTSCQVPYAPDYIERARQRGVFDKKRKTVKC
jgi:3-methyladenine DNA glycosylase AlkD